MSIIGDKNIQFAMVRTGDADIVQRLDAPMVPIAEDDPNVVVVAREGVSTTSFFIRLVPPWDNKALRQAIAYAVDREAIGTSVFGGRGRPAQSIVGPSHGQWFDSMVNVYDRNFDKVNEKLAEAGYSSGFEFSAPCRVSGVDSQSCEVVQASLAEAGITMNIQPYENVTYFADFVGGKHDGPLTSFWSARPDPGILLRLLYHTNGSQNNWSYSNPKVDQLIEQADGVYDVAEAKWIYNEIQTIVAEDAPTVYLWWWNAFFGVRKEVRNFDTYLDGIPRFGELWLDK